MGIKTILIGAGFMGRTHIKSAQGLKEIEYIAVVDAHLPAAQELANQLGVMAFSTVKEALDSGAAAKAADICTPTPCHVRTIKECAQAGLHILCEKPLAGSIEDAFGIEQSCANAGVNIMVAQVLRFWPEYVYAVDVAKKGTFGRLLSVECKRLSSSPGWNSWMMQKRIGGGAVLDLQIHDMDFVFQLLGKPKAIDARGIISGDAVNHVYNSLDYENGMPVHIEASYLMPNTYPFRMYYRLDFTTAVLEMDFWRQKGQRLRIYPKDGEAFFPELDNTDAYASELAYFGTRIGSNSQFEKVPLSESMTALEMCLASEKSCRLKQALR